MKYTSKLHIKKNNFFLQNAQIATMSIVYDKMNKQTLSSL